MSRQQRLNRILDNLYIFLSLVAFAALLLGCIGVASAIHVYTRQKITTVAILRCMGAQSNQVLCIYAIQAIALGLIGTGCGSLLGVGIQYLLPSVLEQILPIETRYSVLLLGDYSGHWHWPESVAALCTAPPCCPFAEHRPCTPCGHLLKTRDPK